MRKLHQLILAGVLSFAVSGVMYAQGGWRHDDRDDRGPYYGRSDQGYRDGVRQGQWDRGHNRRFNYETREWRNSDRFYRDAYRRGYEEGYSAAYTGGYRGNYPYPNQNPYPGQRGPYGRGGGYGNYGRYDSLAYETGLRDGQLDGRSDAIGGHSFRPTERNNYKHADRGYNSSFGSRDAYKQTYRSGYMQGYQQGYGNNGYGRRRY